LVIRPQASAAYWSKGQREGGIWIKRQKADRAVQHSKRDVFGDDSFKARTMSERAIDVAPRRVAAMPRPDDSVTNRFQFF
jgi:hypothetical protein